MEFNTLGKRISSLRTFKDLTQGQLAELLNLNVKSISKWENDDTQPTLDELQVLAKYFNVSFDYLLTGECRNTDMQDCGFTKENNWFRYRVGAIIVENGCVLFVGNKNENYLYSVGGGVHMGETAEDAVLREVYEETGVHYEIDRLAVVHENFFNESSGVLKELDCHEICLYFLMRPRGTQELHSDSYTYGAREEMHWIPVADLDKYKAYPSFMKDYLTCEHQGIEHIITDERV